jgi:hypothetical protein
MSDKFRIYPNPVSGNTVLIDLPYTQDANWSYDLISLSGQIVASEMLPINANQTDATIISPRKIISGIYILRLKNNNRIVSVKQVEIYSK